MVQLIVLLALFVVGTYVSTDMVDRLGVNPGVVPITGTAALIAVRWLLAGRHDGWAFVLTAAAIVLSTVTVFMVLYPRVMVSSLDPAWSLTTDTSSS